jgi:hypothetical protein
MTRKIEMLDGRVYTSTDNWATVWRGSRRVTGREADLVRFLHAMGASS